MPELAEVRIMSDYINHNVRDRKFTKLFHVEKGNESKDSNLIHDFSIDSNSFGKELILKVFNESSKLTFSVFMGMSGNWKFVPTSDWNNTKFVRMRLDSDDGNSLILHGGYMGPKYKLGGFNGVKRGPDPTKQFEEFKNKILDNLDNKVFNGLICDVLLNQEYFNGIGNYLRSTILYYLDVNPFDTARNTIISNSTIIDMCRDIPMKAYNLNGGQLKDWKNPFDSDYSEFKDWVFYQKGLSCKDKTGRTFWYSEKWKDKCTY